MLFRSILTEADLKLSKEEADKFKKVIDSITANNDDYHRDGYTMGFFEGENIEEKEEGKPLNEDNIFHMKRELGDVMWYWINACRALGLDPNDVIAENVRKLEARYPGGAFDPYYSENRKEGDL